MLDYLFDFGDNWLFEAQLEKLEPVNPKIRRPMVIDGRGQAPPQYPNFDDEDWDEEERAPIAPLADGTAARMLRRG